MVSTQSFPKRVYVYLKSLNKKNPDFSFLEFLSFLVFTALLAGILYAIQEWVLELHGIEASLFRMIKMLLIYVFLPVLYSKHRHISMRDWGLANWNITGFLLGIIVYLLGAIVFLHYRIFQEGWLFVPMNEVLLSLGFIAVMASITDFWLRGFVLLTVEKRYGWGLALLVQNTFWFGLHYYEVLLLEPYIGYWGAIALTLFLGFFGDLVVLKYKHIYGVMIGHILLNVINIGYATNWYHLFP